MFNEKVLPLFSLFFGQKNCAEKTQYCSNALAIRRRASALITDIGFLLGLILSKQLIGCLGKG